MDKPVEFEIDGNYVSLTGEQIVVRLSRENELNLAVHTYSEYVLSKSKLPYNKWLDEELKAEIEARLRKELLNEKSES